MKVNICALDVALARRCMSISDLRIKISPSTLNRVYQGEDVKPKTVGRIAQALGVDVLEIVELGD